MPDHGLAAVVACRLSHLLGQDGFVLIRRHPLEPNHPLTRCPVPPCRSGLRSSDDSSSEAGRLLDRLDLAIPFGLRGPPTLFGCADPPVAGNGEPVARNAAVNPQE